MIKTLSLSERKLYSDHLLRLNASDRHLRFASQITDGAILNHVFASNPDNRVILVSTNEDGDAIAACEVCFMRTNGNTRAEIGLSVNDGYRGNGLGTALFQKAVELCKQRQIHSLMSYCAAHNKFMMRIAKTQGMTVDVAFGDAEATLKL